MPLEESNNFSLLAIQSFMGKYTRDIIADLNIIRGLEVAPGFAKTAMGAKILGEIVGKMLQYLSRFHLGHYHDNAYAFLASDETSYNMDHLLHMDGGMI
ncbi:hypothetical protein [Solibacillus sp. FSL H8-0538]|uniref:hypothetical protein n=1 Tax=Solibacillus sp. FSL H8-0538 TaxID=2921400 RepID=UPI0030F6758F